MSDLIIKKKLRNIAEDINGERPSNRSLEGIIEAIEKGAGITYDPFPKTLKGRLRELGLQLNGVRPTQKSLRNIVNNIVENYEGGGGGSTEHYSVTTLSTKMPKKLNGMSAATVGNYIYIIGGWYYDEESQTDLFNNIIYKFDTETETFSEIETDISNLPYNCAVVVVEKKIYIWRSSGVYEFDTENETTQYSYSSIYCSHGAYMYYDDNIYLAGGQIGGSGYATDMINSRVVSTGVEENVGNLDLALSDMAYVQDSSKLYIFGGAPTNTNQIIVFNAITKKSEILKTQPIETLCEHTAQIIGKTAYIFGGSSETGYSKKIYKFNTKKEEYTLIDEELPRGLSFIASGVVGNKIYLFGGMDSEGDSTDIVKFTVLDDKKDGKTEIIDTKGLQIYPTDKITSDDEKIYFGGNEYRYLCSMDVKNNSFEQLNDSSFVEAYHMLETKGDFVYSGYTYSSSNLIYTYNKTTKETGRITLTNSKRYNYGVIVGDYFYFFVAANQTGNDYKRNINTGIETNLGSNYKNNAVYSNESVSITTIGTKIYFLETSASNDSPLVLLEFDTETEQYTQLDIDFSNFIMTTAFGKATITNYNGNLYFFGIVRQDQSYNPIYDKNIYKIDLSTLTIEILGLTLPDDFDSIIDGGSTPIENTIYAIGLVKNSSVIYDKILKITLPK